MTNQLFGTGSFYCLVVELLGSNNYHRFIVENMKYMKWEDIQSYIISIILQLCLALNVTFLLSVNVLMGLLANDAPLWPSIRSTFNTTSLLFGFIVSCFIVIWLHRERLRRSNQSSSLKIFIRAFFITLIFLIANYIMSAVTDGYELFFGAFKQLRYSYSGIDTSYPYPLLVALIGGILLAYAEAYFNKKGYHSHDFLRYGFRQDQLSLRDSIPDIILVFFTLEINVIMGLNLGTPNPLGPIYPQTIIWGIVGAFIYIGICMLIRILMDKRTPYSDGKNCFIVTVIRKLYDKLIAIFKNRNLMSCAFLVQNIQSLFKNSISEKPSSQEKIGFLYTSSVEPRLFNNSASQENIVHQRASV